MKTSVSNINESAFAQIKPDHLTRFLHFTIKHVKISILLLLAFFFSTSYVSEEFAMYDFKSEFYPHEMHVGIQSRMSIDTFSLYTDHASLYAWNIVQEFFRKNDFNPVWTINQNLNDAALQVLQLLNNARYYGLDKNLYNYEKLIMLYENIRITNRSDTLLLLRQDFELLLTDACFRFMIHLNTGIVSLDTMLNETVIKSLSEILYKGIKNDNLANKILALQPRNSNYRNLQKALEKFVINRVIDGETIEIPEPAKDSAMSYNIAKLTLKRLGYLNPETADCDSVFYVTLKEFQKYHGLKQDGILNKNTRKALALSTRERFLMVALALDKLRKEVVFAENFVYINIPSYKLRVVSNNKINRTFNVVVGKPSTPTPELTSKLGKIVTAPEWNVPKSITMNEILPHVKKDSTYLIRNNFKVIDRQLNEVAINSISWKDMKPDSFNYYFVQNSGSSNALGLLKFSFSNPYMVYIHDTPSKRYFNEEFRAYSHGCVRLENPEQLASFLVEQNLKGEQKPDISNLIKNKINHEINLSEPIDIYIRYLTCETDEDLNLYFYKDIYNKDSKIIQSLFN